MKLIRTLVYEGSPRWIADMMEQRGVKEMHHVNGGRIIELSNKVEADMMEAVGFGECLSEVCKAYNKEHGFGRE